MPSTSNNLAERLRETAKDFADDHYLTDLLNEAAAALEQNSTERGQVDASERATGESRQTGCNPASVEPNSSAQAETPRMNALRAKMATHTMDENILLETIGEVERQLAALGKTAADNFSAAVEAQERAETAEHDRDAAIAWIRVLGEECVLAGYPAGDRDVILRNVRSALGRKAMEKDRELLLKIKQCVKEMLDEHYLHGHITDAKVKWRLHVEPAIDAALAERDLGKEIGHAERLCRTIIQHGKCS